jgi:hypothetical protein
MCIKPYQKTLLLYYTQEFDWHLRRKPILMKIGAVICLVLSCFSFLGVVCSMHKVPSYTTKCHYLPYLSYLPLIFTSHCFLSTLSDYLPYLHTSLIYTHSTNTNYPLPYVTYKVPNQVSVYFLAVHDTDSTSQAGIAIFILVTLGYTAYMVTWALFQVRKPPTDVYTNTYTYVY